MREIGAFTVKTHLSQLLDSVSHGETIAITRHGKVIAFLTPAESKSKPDISDTIAGMIKLRKKVAKRGVKITLKEIEQMRKSGQK